MRESTGTADEDAARAWLRGRQKMIDSGVAPGPRRVTVGDLPARIKCAYVNEEDPSPERRARYDARMDLYFHHLTAFFGAWKPAKDIRLDEMEDYVAHRREEGAASSTIRSEVAALGRGIRLALRRAPTLPRIVVKNARGGFFTNAEMARLLPHLAQYMQSFTEAAYITGWRRGELRNLHWTEVDWERGVIRLLPRTTKNDLGREFPVAAHPRLEELLLERRAVTSALEKRTGALCPWVFWHGDGRRVAWFHDGWRTACEKAGLPGRLFHDLRRSAVRNLIDAGVAQSVAMTITGHLTASVFRRYEIRDATDVRAAVEKLAVFHSTPAPAAAKVLPLRRSDPDSE